MCPCPQRRTCGLDVQTGRVRHQNHVRLLLLERNREIAIFACLNPERLRLRDLRLSTHGNGTESECSPVAGMASPDGPQADHERPHRARCTRAFTLLPPARAVANCGMTATSALGPANASR